MDFLVSVRCFTYNHAPYIEDTLNGFVMQETSFPYVCIIVDDASTDGEPQVIKRYLENNFDCQEGGVARQEETENYEMFFSRHKSNPNCFFAVFFLKYNHYGSVEEDRKKYQYISEFYDCSKYRALCEGDDYWVAPSKLQIQVDFMEANPEYGLCHTDFNLSDGSKRRHYKEIYTDGEYYPGTIEHENARIGTLTVLFRKETLDKTPKYYLKEPFVAGDKARWYELSKVAKVKYIPEVTACYRILPTSASHFTTLDKMLAFRRGLQDIREFYAEKYGILLTDYKTYCTTCLRDCYVYSDAKRAHLFYLFAKERKSLTLKGLFFYLGTKFPFVKKLTGFIRSPK